MPFHRRIGAPATGLQLQHLQPCVSCESRFEIVQLQALLLPVHEWHVVFAGGAAVPGCQQLAAEHRAVWVRENLHRDCVHTEQLEEDQLVRKLCLILNVCESLILKGTERVTF